MNNILVVYILVLNILVLERVRRCFVLTAERNKNAMLIDLCMINVIT